MEYFCLALLAVFTVSNGYKIDSETVVKFEQEIENDASKVLPFFGGSSHNEGIKPVLMSEFGTKLQAFEYKNCGDPVNDLFLVEALTVKPDPVTFPGSITVSFKVDIRKTLKSPLAASVVIQRKLGSKWIELPCLGQLGSCDYDDLCTFTQYVAQCPPSFVQWGVPCKCPYDKGNYNLKPTTWTIGTPVLPTGDYKATIKIKMNGAHVACYDVSVSVG